MFEKTVAENAWEVDEGLYRILLPLPWAVPFVNVYLIRSKDQFMLVDAGMGWSTSLRALGRALKAIGVGPAGLHSLVLTHRHPDHAAGAGSVHARWGGKVLLHPDDMAYDFPSPEEMARWALSHGMDPAQVAKLAAGRREPGLEPLPADTEPLETGRPLILGDLAFEVIHVPGHCPGQVMLLEPSRGWLLAADQVLSVLAPNVWHNPGTTGDPLGQYLESLERTARIKAGLILPSHGAPMQGGLAENVQAMLQFQHEYIARVLGQVGREPRSAWALAVQLNPRMAGNPREGTSDLSEVLAALVYLQERGRVARTAEGLWVRQERREALL
jgi:glyoxylase-like metal-dependent hydrolase (beta-lactamase superfamily II)